MKANKTALGGRRTVVSIVTSHVSLSGGCQYTIHYRLQYMLPEESPPRSCLEALFGAVDCPVNIPLTMLVLLSSSAAFLNASDTMVMVGVVTSSAPGVVAGIALLWLLHSTVATNCD